MKAIRPLYSLRSGRIIFAVACAISSDIFISSPCRADGFVWQKVSLQSESVSAQNLIISENAPGGPCFSSARNQQDVSAPPNVELYKTLSLDSAVVSVAWSPDQKHLAVGEKLGSELINVFDFPAMSVKLRIDKKTGWGGSQVEFTYDGKYLITTNVLDYNGIDPTAFSLIELNTGSIIKNIPGYSSPPNYPLANSSQNFILSRDGKYLFAEFNGDLIHTYIYQTDRWSIISKIAGGIGPMAIGPKPSEMTYVDDIFDSNDLKKLDNIANLLIWNAATKTFGFRIKLINYAHFTANGLAINGTGCEIALSASNVRAVDQDGRASLSPIQNPIDAIKIWYPRSGVIADIGAATPIQGLSFDQNAPLLAFIDGEDNIFLMLLSNRPDHSARLVNLGHFNVEATDVAFSPDGRFLAVAGDDEIRIYQIKIQ